MAGASIQDMRLEHNELRSLEGSLFSGMKELQKLNLSHNALGPRLGLGDLRGINGLRILDLSYNELTTLENTSEVSKMVGKANAQWTRKCRATFCLRR